MLKFMYMKLKDEQDLNLYDYACKTNQLAEKFNKQLFLIFKMIDDNENENAIDYEIKILNNIYANIETNEGLNGFFKHYAMNLTIAIETYKNSKSDVKLSDLTSTDLIYMSSKIDEILKQNKSI